jgi:hypothetical protein
MSTEAIARDKGKPLENCTWGVSRLEENNDNALLHAMYKTHDLVFLATGIEAG